jgi:CheY-like chemotaxis protein
LSKIEDFTAGVIEALLYGIGFEHVDRAADGLDAWTMMHQRRYALVICDYRMAPMSGLMFLQSVREDPEHPAADRRQRSRDPQRGGAARGRCLPAKPFTPKVCEPRWSHDAKPAHTSRLNKRREHVI